MPIDPITGAILGSIAKAAFDNAKKDFECQVCGRLQYGNWVKWTCCYKAQCSSCQARTRSANKCCGCGDRGSFG